MTTGKYAKINWIFKYLSILFFLIFFLNFNIVDTSSSPSIYGYSPYFRSYSSFFMPSLTTASSSNYALQTSLINQNIIRCGLSLGQFTKMSSAQFSFNATVAYGSTTTDSFTITLSLLTPKSINIRLFLIVIMDQGATPMIDVNTYCIGGMNPISTIMATQQFYTVQIDVPSNTIFSDTTDLQVYAFLSSFSVLIQTAERSLTSQIVDVSSNITNSTSISSTFHIGAYMAEISACLVNILYNPNLISTTILNGNSFHYDVHFWEMNTSINSNLMNYPSWGPSFDPKCFIGIYYNEYMYGLSINHLLSYNLYSNYYRFDSTGTLKTKLIFFCFGYGFECGQAETFLDAYSNECYTSATCPVTPYGNYITQQLCPKCLYKNCLQCQSLDRSICVSCDNTTHRQIINDNCTCMPGYIDNTSSANITCTIDCSYFMQGCDSASCSSTTNCTACQSTSLYYFFFNVARNEGQCILCNQSLNNCTNCSSSTVCTQCQKGTYLFGSLCSDCLTSSFSNCIQCEFAPITLSITCFNCQIGYSLANFATKCGCNFTYYLKNCTACTDPRICTSCPLSYALTAINNLTDCMLCSDLIPSCIDCTDERTCTVCDPLLYPYYNSTSNKTECKICSIVIQSCTVCNNQSSCKICDTYFGVSSTQTCESCNSKIVNCFTCLNSSICESCQIGYYLAHNSCRLCSIITPNCIECNISIFLLPACSACDNGYYLYSDLSSQKCISCSIAMSNCLQCSNATYCDVCASPFTFDVLHSCQNCTVGTYVTGTCSSISGCSTSRQINGVAVCLSCDISFGFQYDSTLKKCICQRGFRMINNSCIQVCGDGIVNNMQCDDGNLINGDGCSQFCIIQSGYTCTIISNGQSDCVLHQDFSIKLNYIQRVMGENAALLSFTITPASTKLQFVDWKSVVTFNLTNVVGISYDYSNGQLLVKIDYNSSINNQNISMNVNFDPNSIISKSSQLNFKMIGINGPLVYENNLSDYKNLSILSFVIIGLALLQFLISTYFHKMIGLQTLQCIQTIYFIRMIITDSYGSSSIYGLNGLNYSNGFSYNSGNTNDLSAIPSYFAKLGLSLQFLGNVNIMLIPIFIAGTIYLIYKVRMLYNKSKFVQTSQKQYKGQYIILKRTSDWFYEHYLFTFSILLLYTISFSSTQLILSKSIYNQTMLNLISFAINMLILMLIVSIVGISIIQRITKHFKSDSISKNQIQNNLDYDQNTNFSFSELYVPIYLIYQVILTLITLSIVADFQYVSQVCLVLTIFYGVLLCIWRPYVYKIHNLGIIFNQFTVVFFIFTIILPQLVTISQNVYSLMGYSTILLLIVMNIIAYLRVFIQWKTQKEESQYKNKRVKNILDQDYYKQKQNALLNNPYMYHIDNNFVTKSQNTILNIDQIQNKYLNQLKLYQNKQKMQQVDMQQVSLKKVKERLKKEHQQLVESEDIEID